MSGFQTQHQGSHDIIVQSCFCGFVSCTCLDHEAESVPVNVRFCSRYEGFFFLLLRTPLVLHWLW